MIVGQRVTKVDLKDKRIRAITLENGSIVSGSEFIDASYEGDLMARAGVTNTYGRESVKQYGESLAGIRQPHFIKNYSEQDYSTPGIEYMHHGQFGADIKARDAKGSLLWGVEAGPIGEVEGADKRIQAYCYRLIATQRNDIKKPWPKPSALRRFAL